MFLTMTNRENRKYPAWLMRVRVGDRWHEVTNILHPGFWSDWWAMWQGERLWALRRYIRHIVRHIDPSIYTT